MNSKSQAALLAIETRYLGVAALGNLLIGCAGLAVTLVSGSQAIMLDAFFNLTYFLTGLFTIKVASMVAHGDDERFPHGYSYFEPLVNGIKGMLMLGVSLMAAGGAVQSLLTGGQPIVAGAAIAYGLFATGLCSLIAWVTHRGANETHSPLVRADMANWRVNALVSACVVFAFCGVYALRAIGLGAWAPYVDPLVVLTVVLISLGVPIRMSWNAVMALLHRAPAEDILRKVTSVVDSKLSELPVTERFVRVVQPGRHRWVLVHVVLPSDFQRTGLGDLDAVRSATEAALRAHHDATFIDMLFTADRRWGAPMSEYE